MLRFNVQFEEQNQTILTSMTSESEIITSEFEMFQRIDGTGTTDHNQLTSRSAANQHPISAITGLEEALAKKADSIEIDEDNYLWLMSDGIRIAGPFGPFGSGSGGGGNNATLKVSNTTGWLFTSVAEKSPCILKLNWNSIDEELSTGKGTLQVYVSNTLKDTKSVDQGAVEVDVSQWLTSGSNKVKLTITDAYGNIRSLNFTIDVVALSISSNFDGKPAFNGDISYYYVPLGDAEKTVYFLLDGEEIGTSKVTLSGQQQDFIIPAQSHGSHTFEVYLTAEIGGTTVESNRLYYDLICTEEGNNTPIIASSYKPVEVEQYDTFTIPYRVYNPAKLTADIVLAEDGTPVQELTVDRTEHQWSHKCDDVGDRILTITCGDVVKTITVPVVESNVTITAVTNNLVLDLSSYGRSNLEADPLVWESNGVSVEFSGFNKSSDGWQLDEDGVTVMRVGGDARLKIPLKLFEKDLRTTGKTIELEFATRDVRNYESVLVSCMDAGRGIEVTSQEAEAASAQSSIGTQYKEEEHIRLTFIIEKRTSSKMMLCYLNGICSGSIAYPEDDDFTQTNAVEISIGSNECTIDLYHIRVYDNDLTRYQVLNNWIADTQVGSLKKARWARNDVYDAYGNIVIEKLPKDLPYLVLECSVLPQFKGDKKKCNGYYIDPIHPERSFRFTDAEIDVQGTSSQYYKRKNYKIKFKGGFILISSDGEVQVVYAMNNNAVPVSTFTFKADVASSEGANNVVLAQLFNDLCPVKTPAQLADPRVRQTIDGHPIVVFWDSGTGPVFLGKYNFNNDKGTEEVFGFQPGDQSWEILQNGTDRVGFRNADFTGDDWKQDFEARYPEDNTDTRWLSEFIGWVASTDTEAATDAALGAAVTYAGTEYTHDTAEYRLAKFVNELPQWADVDHSVFYYLFTLVFLCIDQREKNAFPTYIAALRVLIWLFYDADSTLGIDNKGKLAFGPFLEDIDYTEAGDPIFNGQANVFWTNMRLGFPDRIQSMYQGWRTSGALSYEVVKARFDSHQGKWPEAIFNEDGFFKYLQPWIEDKDGSYLSMNLGKKELQRAWWLFNRFRYLDSKFVTGTSMENRIIIRARSKASVFLKSYVKMYGNVFFNALRVSHRMEAGQEYEFVWDASGAEDAVIGINDADLLTSLGDLSPLMIETIDLSKATHLTHLYLGSGAEGYENKNLLSLTLGNNTLLKMLDVRNCTGLAQSVDASGCTNVEEIYFDGTAITGLSVPNGGVLKILHLPDTITNLTVKNQPTLSEFVIPSYSNITTLNLENAGVLDTLALDILKELPAKSRVRLVNATMNVNSFDDIRLFVENLDKMTGIDETGANVPRAQVSCRVYIDMLSVPELREIAEIQTRYPSIVVYYNRVETYTVRFYSDGVLMQTVTGVEYGSDATYSGVTPTREPASVMENWEFTHWSPKPVNVTVDMDCHAQFKNTVSMARVIVDRSILGEYGNDRVTSVGAHAFHGSASLTGVNFPNVTHISDNAFDSCSSLTTADFPNVNSIGGSIFNKCSSLTSVNLPNAVTSNFTTYGADNMFTDCVALQVAKIPNITILRDSFFSGCKALTSVDFMKLTFIGASVFKGCMALASCIIRDASGICRLNHHNNFANTPIEAGTGYIYVPSSLIEDYKVATNWAAYADQFRALEDYTVDGTITGDLDETKI